MRTARLLVPLAAVLLVGGGCIGAVDGEPAGPRHGCRIPPAPLTRARRLSHVELENTLTDLFPNIDVSGPTLVPDEHTRGLDNDADRLVVSETLVDQYRQRAELVAERLHVELAASPSSRAEFYGCDPELDAPGCTRSWLQRFGRRAVRRPLTEPELARWVELHGSLRDGDAGDFETATQLLVEAMLQSPDFLYRVELGAAPSEPTSVVTAHELATRLSYFLWRSMPDEELLDAADRGELDDELGVEMQARRLLADPRARSMVVDLYRRWLDLDRVSDATKSSTMFPEWSDALRADIREESARFIQHVVFDGEGTMRALLTDRSAFVTSGMAALYGIEAPGAGPSSWVSVSLPETERAGLLTRAAFLAGQAHPSFGSPILRGVRVLERLYCRSLLLPGDVPPLDDGAEETAPVRTNRERYAVHVRPGCATCHRDIDPVGFSFEHYDAIGAFRVEDGGYPVDASGASPEGVVVADAVELSSAIADSPEVAACMAETFYRYATGHTPGPAEDCHLRRIRAVGETTGGNVIEVLVAIATSDPFRARR